MRRFCDATPWPANGLWNRSCLGSQNEGNATYPRHLRWNALFGIDSLPIGRPGPDGDSIAPHPRLPLPHPLRGSVALRTTGLVGQGSPVSLYGRGVLRRSSDRRSQRNLRFGASSGIRAIAGQMLGADRLPRPDIRPNPPGALVSGRLGFLFRPLSLGTIPGRTLPWRSE